MFAPHTIRLGAAKRIFSDVEFEEVYLGDKRVGFKAQHDGKSYADESITVICSQLWEANATSKNYGDCDRSRTPMNEAIRFDALCQEVMSIDGVSSELKATTVALLKEAKKNKDLGLVDANGNIKITPEMQLLADQIRMG